MLQNSRWGLSREQKQDLWSRWKAGQSLSDIGRALGNRPGQSSVSWPCTVERRGRRVAAPRRR